MHPRGCEGEYTQKGIAQQNVLEVSVSSQQTRHSAARQFSSGQPSQPTVGRRPVQYPGGSLSSVWLAPAFATQGPGANLAPPTLRELVQAAVNVN